MSASGIVLCQSPLVHSSDGASTEAPHTSTFPSFYPLCHTFTVQDIKDGSFHTAKEEYFKIFDCTKEIFSPRNLAGPDINPYAMDVGKCLVYSGRNRWSNILPYDKNRVDFAGGSYINASHIELAGKHYIACQAPIVGRTFEHHWRMIWEQESNVIVMLTKFIEDNRQKAEPYWPEKVDETMKFEDIQVTLIAHEKVILEIPQSHEPEEIRPALDQDTTEYEEDGEVIYLTYEPCVQKRTLKLTNLRDGTEREVTHFHYEGWPDHGTSTPEEFNALLNTVEGIKLTGPLVVHCSAGVGRAGTFIATDSLRQDIKKIKLGQLDDKIAVMQRVMELRHQRYESVQTTAQYVLIYQTLQTYLKS